MTTLVFDTETSGFYDPKISLDHPLQGRVIQLACVLLNDDFNIVNSFYSLIKPEGLQSINPGAQAAHGISIEQVDKFGIPARDALEIFDSFYQRADCKVAHNIKFDSTMLDVEMQLNQKIELYRWNNLGHFCTMREMTPIVKLPGNGRFGQQYKWPKLQEAYYHIFSRNFDKAHDAMADVLACKDIFKWLVDGGHLILPKSMAV